MSKYVEISFEKFNDLMTTMHFVEIKVEGTFEKVWSYHIKNTNYEIRIYSTICVNSNVSRSSGSDAIRCIIYDTRENKLIKLEKRVHRTEKALINTRARCRELYKYVKNNVCTKCGGLLIERTSKTSHKFLGCSNFPKCKETKTIIQSQLTLKLNN